MLTTRRAAQHTLLVELLDGYERSRSYGRPGPWARDVIVRLDADTFPAAFDADGRELLAALRAAAGELGAAGAARLVHARGWSDGEPTEVRLGPGEVAAAYGLAAAHGYEPLAQALAAVAGHAGRLAQTVPEAPWLAAWLGALAERVLGADLGPLGMQVERFKRDHRDLLQALTACVALGAGRQRGWERVVSESLFGDSKRLGELRPLLVELLVRADPRWDGVGPSDAFEVLEAYGVRRKPGLIVCAGAAGLRVGDGAIALEAFRPVAHLPEAWADALADGLAARGLRTVTTVENEFPFLAYVEEAGGPAALGARGEVVVYTAGFPTPSLCTALAALAQRLPELGFRHFGDADLGGLRIWWHLRQNLLRPVALYRVDRAWLEAAVARRAGTPLRPSERAALVRLRRELDRGTGALCADIAQAIDLLDGLVHHGVKVEQEREA